MTERDRLVIVLSGKTPDRVPWFADLGHWYRVQSSKMWNLFTVNNCEPGIIELHREIKAGWYIEVGSLHEEYYVDSVVREKELNNNKAIERFITPLGVISMIRKWNEVSFSWDIVKRMVENIDDLKILLYAIERKRYKPKYEKWKDIDAIGKDVGLGFPTIPYTGLGILISYYMGVENTIYALYDEPEMMNKFIQTQNEKQLELIDLYCDSPAPHILHGDNLSSDIQPPGLFNKYSFQQYKAIADKVHKKGKTVSAHLDGRLSNIIGLVAATGTDVADACTPKPSGDLSAYEIRKQAGNDMILMGGISPVMWLPQTPEKVFIEHVKEWLQLRKINSRLIQSAGDQVPPGTDLNRIKLVYNIVEEFGRY